METAERWSSLVKDQNTLFTTTLERNQHLETRLKDLEREVKVWKQAYAAADSNNGGVTPSNSDIITHRSIEGSPSDKSQLIYCIINGDTCIFSPSFLRLGKEGGKRASSTLLHLLQSQFTPSTNIIISIHFNHAVVCAGLAKERTCSLDEFYDFVNGFNNVHFLVGMVDFKCEKKERAGEARLRETTTLYSRLPQVSKVIYGGALDTSDTSYFTLLQSSNLLNKLILLKTLHTQLPSQNTSAKLNIPIIDISSSNLFAQPSSSHHRSNSFQKQLVHQETEEDDEESGTTESQTDAISSPNHHKANGNGKKKGKKDKDKGDKPPERVGAKTPTPPWRRIDPSKPLDKQFPPLCNLFYLAGECKKNAQGRCRFAHDYTITESQISSMAKLVRTTPCGFVSRDRRCPQGVRCILGHICPQGPACKFRKEGKCRFTDKMHASPSESPKQRSSNSNSKDGSGGKEGERERDGGGEGEGDDESMRINDDLISQLSQ